MFSPENMFSLAICRTPVRTPNFNDWLSFREADSRVLMNWSTFSLTSPSARFIGPSYSSISTIAGLP